MSEKIKRFFNSPAAEWLILSGLLLLQILLVASFLRVTHALPYEDAAEHLIKSITALKDLKAGALPYFLGRDRFYPPLLYQTAAIVYLVFPPDLLSGTLSQIPYWAILIFSLFGIGKLLFSRLTGYLAGFYFLTAPLTLLYSWQFRPDLPATAFGVLCVYLLLKSDNFKNRLYSWGFGLALGLGMLLRWWVGYQLLGVVLFYWLTLSFAYFKNNGLRILSFLLPGGLLFLFIEIGLHYPHPRLPGEVLFSWGFWVLNLLEGLLLWLALEGLNRAALKNGSAITENLAPWKNFCFALVIVYLLDAWLYFHPQFALLNGMLFEFGVGRATLEWPFLGFYWHLLTNIGLYWVYLGLLLIGSVWFLFKYKTSPQRKIYLLIVLTAGLLLVLLPSKKDRYLLPWLALASPLAVGWFTGLRKLKPLAVPALLALGIFYALTGWIIPSGAYAQNPVLAFINPPSAPLGQRKIEPVIELKKMDAFLSVLPPQGEKVLVSRLCFDTDHNIPYYNYALFSRLGQSRIDFTAQKQLGDYQYLIYAHQLDDDEGDLKRLLAGDDYYAAIKGMKFTVSASCPFPELNFEYRLIKINKE